MFVNTAATPVIVNVSKVVVVVSVVVVVFVVFVVVVEFVVAIVVIVIVDVVVVITVVVVVSAVSPTRGPVDCGVKTTPLNSGAPPSGASTRKRGGGKRLKNPPTRGLCSQTLLHEVHRRFLTPFAFWAHLVFSPNLCSKCG